ncbi:hypothetical protein AC249_AIPGENE13626 [Exaiptasia diaphana]|nr:hypothetical protein AC249_AIPGENE13626 [Exaiptasia diaphana]
MSTFARYLGNQPPPTDGTEGTTSIKLTLKDENEPLVLNGCFIHNDENLWKLINDYNYITKHKDTKYFTYFCCFYENLKNHLLKTEIIFHLHRLYKEDLDKSWPIIQGEDNAFFLHGGCHVFLPACHEDLVREKKVKKFLKIHSKPILYKTHEIVSGKYKGLAKVNGSIKFVEIAMTSCTNGLVLSNNIFQKLVNGPLMYSDKVVGYYYKNPDGSKITVYMLATRGKMIVPL